TGASIRGLMSARTIAGARDGIAPTFGCCCRSVPSWKSLRMQPKGNYALGAPDPRRDYEHVVYQIGDRAVARHYERLLAASIRETRERLDLKADEARIRKAMVAA